MYKRGIVKEVAAPACRVRVTLPDRGDLVTGWLDVLVRSTSGAKHYDLPSVGNQVACLLEEDASAGCVLGAVYSSVDAPTASSASVRRYEFGDGGAVEYDASTHVLKVTTPAHIELAGSGAFVALASLVQAELANIASALSTHTHTGVTTGPGVSGTAPPVYTPGSVASSKVKAG